MKIKKEAPNDPLWEKLSICAPGFAQLAASEIAIKSIELLLVISNWNEFSLHNIFHSECLHEISLGQQCCHLVLYKGNATHMMLIHMIFPWLFTPAGSLQKSDNILRAWLHSGIMCLLLMPWVFPSSDLHWCSDCHYQKSETSTPVHSVEHRSCR